MGLSIKEGMDLAEREAWRTWGKRHTFGFTWGKRLGGYVVLPLGVAGGLGWVAYKAWGAIGHAFAGGVSAPSVSAPAGHLPLVFWFVAAVLAAATVALFTGFGRIRSLGLIAAHGLLVILGWLAWGGYLIGTLS